MIKFMGRFFSLPEASDVEKREETNRAGPSGLRLCGNRNTHMGFLTCRFGVTVVIKL